MKRDMDIIRRIMLEIEDTDEPFLSYTGEDAKHVALLLDAGFVDAHLLKAHGIGIARAVVERLTWKGFEFLAVMRDDSIWKKAKETIFKPLGGVAFDVLFAWLKAQSTKALGLHEVDGSN